MPVRRKTLEEYFWARVKKTDGCWLWTGRRDSNGYGIVQLGAREPRTTASRVSLIIHRGHPGSNKIFALHKCDNPPCVNPEHLFWGAHADNMKDCANKGRAFAEGKSWKKNLTHCKNGHEFNEKNTYVWADENGRPKRYCRPCRALAEHLRRIKWKSTAEKSETI